MTDLTGLRQLLCDAASHTPDRLKAKDPPSLSLIGHQGHPRDSARVDVTKDYLSDDFNCDLALQYRECPYSITADLHQTAECRIFPAGASIHRSVPLFNYCSTHTRGMSDYGVFVKAIHTV